MSAESPPDPPQPEPRPHSGSVSTVKSVQFSIPETPSTPSASRHHPTSPFKFISDAKKFATNGKSGSPEKPDETDMAPLPRPDSAAFNRVTSPDCDGTVVVRTHSVEMVRTPSVELAPGRINVNNHPSGSVNGKSESSRPKYERMHSGRLAVQQMSEDMLDAMPVRRRYRYRDMFLTIWAIGTYLGDFITDWYVAAGFYKDRDFVWFGLTVAFIVVPHLFMMCFSFAWYVQDHISHPHLRVTTWRIWMLRIVILVLQLAPVLRYVDSLRYGYSFRNSHPDTRLQLYQSLCYENADAAMLRLFEAFMEACPQLILQIYILVKKRLEPEKFDLLQTMQIVSIFFSWFSLATAMASFHRAQRFSQAKKGSMSILGTIWQFCWHLFIFASRVIAIALFTVRFGFWGPVFCGLHVSIMFAWVLTMRTDFCPNRLLEFFYNMALACLYLFAFLNARDTPTRWKYVFYYGLYYTENVVLISLWYAYTPDYHWFKIPAMLAVIGGFWLGIVFFMLPYYRYLHPDKGIWMRKRRDEYRVQEAEQENRNGSTFWTAVLDCCL